TLWFIAHIDRGTGVPLGRYRPWYRQKIAPSQLDVAEACREASMQPGFFPYHGSPQSWPQIWRNTNLVYLFQARARKYRLYDATKFSSYILQAFISPSYAPIRRSNWPLMAGRVSSKPRFSYPWDRGCTGSPFRRSLTASSQYGTLIVHRGQGFSMFQDDLSST